MKLNYFDKNGDKSVEFTLLSEYFITKGGMILCEANQNKKYNNDENECKELNSIIDFPVKYSNNIPFQCESDKYLDFSSSERSILDVDLQLKKPYIIINYKCFTYKSQIERE